MSFTMTSTSFQSMGMIPVRHTCDGLDLSPPLTWTGAPEDTRCFVLIVDDPDAPDPEAPTMTWVHWVLFNMPASVHELPAGVVLTTLPPGTMEGINDWKITGYRGPCPPVGRHRYFHKLFALDAQLPALDKPDLRALTQAMQGHVLAYAELIGQYKSHS
jgi:Raf kinase inhibitor-like YbhB/YbcL family protein